MGVKTDGFENSKRRSLKHIFETNLSIYMYFDLLNFSLHFCSGFGCKLQ